MAANFNKRRLNVSPGGKTAVVRVELSLLNGCPFDHVLPTNEILEIWNKALNLKHIPLVRQANFRGPNNTFRINYRLKDSAYLSELISNPEITYERKGSRGTDVYTGRVLDVESIEEAKLGETVTVIIKRSNAELSEDQIAEWLIRFGKIVLPPRYKKFFGSRNFDFFSYTASRLCVTKPEQQLPLCTSCCSSLIHQLVSKGELCVLVACRLKPSTVLVTAACKLSCDPPITRPVGLVWLVIDYYLPFKFVPFFTRFVKDSVNNVEVDVCQADIILENHIPETLPAYGLRLRTYYHGNKTQCNKCYGLGHKKYECKANQVST